MDSINNRCITLAMILRPSACLPSNPSYCITSEVARTVSILKHIVSNMPAWSKTLVPVFI